MISKKEFYFSSQDGTSRIHAVKWENASSQPRAVLQIAHGIAEYIMRYDNFASFMAENGYVVVGNDHLGHGKSKASSNDEGFFAEEDGWNCVKKDMHKLYSITKSEYPNLPYFLLGHSMGSFLARTYIIDYPNDLQGCIISGTGNQSAALCDAGLAVISAMRIKRGVRGKSKLIDRLCFGAYNKRIPSPKTGYDWLSRDEAVVSAYVNDPDCGFMPTIGLAGDMLGGIKYITNERNARKMNKSMPVYFFSGAEDPVGDYGVGVKKAYLLFNECGMEHVSIKLYPGARHETLNEINKNEVYADTLSWLNRRIPSAM